MATYVNDLRLKEIATGDESGTWGTSTNTNLELIGEAFSFGTEGITTNADTHTTTIADGSTDPGRSLYLKYTGTLDSACTITIGPNTVSKLWFIENGTSGSQNIIISQGSGANITIPAGDTKAIYSDGAGSGAAMIDAFASLSVVDLKVQDDLTVTDDMTVGGTLGVTGVLTATSLDISGDIDVDGTTNLDVVDIDGAVDMASTLTVGSTINGLTLAVGGLSGPTSQNMAINTPNSFRVNIDSNNDGSSEVFVVGHGQTGVDNSNNVLLGITESGVGTFNGTLTITTTDNSNTLTLISTDADASVGPVLDLYRNSGSPADDDFLGKINFRGRNDNSQDVDYGFLSYFISDASDGTEDAFMQMGLMKGGSSHLLMEATSTETVFNQGSVDQDFRVESDGQTHALFVDAGNNKVGINQATPLAPLHVTIEGTAPTISSNTVAVFNRNGGVSHEAYISIISGATGASAIHFGDNDEDIGRIEYRHASANADHMAFQVAGAEKARILSTGGITFNGDTSTANSLDDYEEGDYDATVTCASGSITLDGSFNRLSYTKVGRLVQVNGQLKISAVSSPSGATTINLPFVVGNFTDTAGAATCPGLGYFNGSAITNGSYVVYQEVVENTGYVRLYVKGTINGASNIGDDITAANSELYINVTYQTET